MYPMWSDRGERSRVGEGMLGGISALLTARLWTIRLLQTLDSIGGHAPLTGDTVQESELIRIDLWRP